VDGSAVHAVIVDGFVHVFEIGARPTLQKGGFSGIMDVSIPLHRRSHRNVHQ
jgi:hypothetical protein